MRRKILFAAFSFFLSTQGLFGQTPSDTTEHGFRLVNHTHRNGPKAKPGESILIHVDTYIGDTLMGSTHNNGGEAREYYIPDSLKSDQIAPFLYDGALLLAAGDSATMFESIDSLIRRFVPASQMDAKELRYEIKVEKVITKADKAQMAAEAKVRFLQVQNAVNATMKDYRKRKLRKKIRTTDSGLKVLIIEPGTGTAVITGETVQTNYYGVFMDGKMFDNSFERGQSLDFSVGTGQMILGVDEGVTYLHHGGKAYFFLPAKLAYGEEGTSNGLIPPNADLVFYVEVL